MFVVVCCYCCYLVEKINNHLFLLFLVTDFIASSSDFNMDTASKNIFFSDFRTFGLYQKFRFVVRGPDSSRKKYIYCI